MMGRWRGHTAVTPIPGRGTRSYLVTETRTAVREGVSNVLGLGVPILCIDDGDESPRCTSCYSTMLLTYPYQQSVVRVGVVGFTPVPRTLCVLVCERDAKRLVTAVKGRILSLKKDRPVSSRTSINPHRIHPRHHNAPRGRSRPHRRPARIVERHAPARIAGRRANVKYRATDVRV